MSSRFLSAALCGSILALGACAQQEEAPEIRPQPMFDKAGNVGCTDGSGRIVWVDVPGAVPIPEYLPPCEELCEDGPLYDSTGQLIDECPPEPQRPRRDRGDDDDDRDPQRPPSSTFDPTRGN